MYSVYYIIIRKRSELRPCQIGILLSVRVRVGFRALSPIKNKCVGEISYIFRNLEKSIIIHVL